LKTQATWEFGSYIDAKGVLLAILKDENEEPTYRFEDLQALAREYAATDPRDLEELKQRTFSFKPISSYLIKEGQLTEAKRNLEYLKSFAPEMKKEILDYIFRTDPKRQRNIIPDFETIQEAAKDALTPSFSKPVPQTPDPSQNAQRMRKKISTNSYSV
jgi:DNA-directed RNA polymerase subunit F